MTESQTNQNQKQQDQSQTPSETEETKPSELELAMKDKGIDEKDLLELVKAIKKEEKPQQITITTKELKSLIDESVKIALKGTLKDNPKPKPADQSINNQNGLIITPMKQKEIKQRTK